MDCGQNRFFFLTLIQMMEKFSYELIERNNANCEHFYCYIVLINSQLISYLLSFRCDFNHR
jgi:hypothetical protein